MKKLIRKLLLFFEVFRSRQRVASKKFKESEKTAVFTTKFVIKNNKEITTVYHFKEDSTWQFSSSDEVKNFEDVAMIVKLGQIIKNDNSILEIADLPLGYFAYRKSKGDKWIIEKIENEN